MLKILTSRFGVLELDEGAFISVPGGLIGFPECQRYVIIQHKPESPFYWFQAVDREDLAFVIVDPALFKPDYHVPLAGALLSDLKADGRDELAFYVIVTIPQGQPQAMTANLLGPLVVNTRTRLARQLVLDDQKFSHRHPIMAASGSSDRQSR